MYELSENELRFYVALLCDKYNMKPTEITRLGRYFRNELWLPITDEELQLAIEYPLIYELNRAEKKLYGMCI